MQYIDTHSHGDTVSRIVADADQFSDGLLMGFTQFFTGVMTILGTIAFMLITNFKIGLVVVLVTPASLFVARFVANHTHKFFTCSLFFFRCKEPSLPIIESPSIYT